jgi:hypothetical protein
MQSFPYVFQQHIRGTTSDSNIKEVLEGKRQKNPGVLLESFEQNLVKVFAFFVEFFLQSFSGTLGRMSPKFNNSFCNAFLIQNHIENWPNFDRLQSVIFHSTIEYISMAL